MSKIKLFSIILLMISPVFAVSSGSAAVASSSQSVSDTVTLLSNPFTVITITVSLLTILAALGTGIKRIFDNKLESRITTLETNVDAHYRELIVIVSSLKADISDKVNKASYDGLVEDQKDLAHSVNVEMDKLNNTVNKLGQVETKLNEMKNHFDDNNKERRDEIRELNATIKGLRENISDDITDLKNVLIKMMMVK